MSAINETAWRRLDELRTICADLAADQDDAVRMFALRVDAMARALKDSVLVPPDLEKDHDSE